ncbi:MAG: hypothetical protein M3Y54_22490 [Bacteroidota bacterium]|nr:hypothetical protein [Bacteroidota bacterium]
MNQFLRAFLLIGFFGGAAGSSYGCSCDGKYTEYKHAIKESTLIFSGRVVRVTSKFVSTKYGQQVVETYKIVPERIWLGASADTISFPYDKFDCFSKYLEVGKKYILFTKPNQPITFCQRVIEVEKEIEKANHDIIILDRRFRKPKRKS